MLYWLEFNPTLLDGARQMKQVVFIVKERSSKLNGDKQVRMSEISYWPEH
jgi:hypothetical protein